MAALAAGPTYDVVSKAARVYARAAPEPMVRASDGPHAPEKPTPSPTTQACSTFWEIGRQMKRPAAASWWTILRRYTVSIRALRADVPSAVWRLETADRLGK